MNHQNLLSIAENLVQPPLNQGLVLLSARELGKMRRVGRLAANLLNHLEPMVQPGVSTQALNDEAERWMQAHGAISATLGYAPPSHPLSLVLFVLVLMKLFVMEFPILSKFLKMETSLIST